jgi:hypothetical protein
MSLPPPLRRSGSAPGVAAPGQKKVIFPEKLAQTNPNNRRKIQKWSNKTVYKKKNCWYD